MNDVGDIVFSITPARSYTMDAPIDLKIEFPRRHSEDCDNDEHQFADGDTKVGADDLGTDGAALTNATTGNVEVY